MISSKDMRTNIEFPLDVKRSCELRKPFSIGTISKHFHKRNGRVLLAERSPIKVKVRSNGELEAFSFVATRSVLFLIVDQESHGVSL